MPAGLDGNPDPVVTPQRSQVLEEVTDEILRRRVSGAPLLVSVDGIDGSGKSTFADELASRLVNRNVAVVRSTIDSFHHPRTIRWRRGKMSPTTTISPIPVSHPASTPSAERSRRPGVSGKALFFYRDL